MDQNSSNSSGTEKRNWRERLGIGGKEMPKISDEFKTAAPLTPDPPLKSPQQITKPAPMAPRPGAAKAPAGGAMPGFTGAPNSEALADKLRSQRAAAETLAEQRVSAARERAEAKLNLDAGSAVEPPPPGKTEPAKPKFTFADEELASAPTEPTARPDVPVAARPRQTAAVPSPPLVPPRPALGGDRFPPQTRAPVPPPQLPQYRAPPPSSYRPVDPASGQAPPPLRTGGSPMRPYVPGGAGQAAYGDARYPGGRLTPDYRRPSETGAGYGEAGRETEARIDQRLARNMPARPRQNAPDEDYGDVFADEPPRPRRRASASEYNNAYREVEDSYEDSRRRSSGPWLLLLALLVAAVATFGIIWYYQTHLKSTVATAAPENVPVVAAPEQPAKTAAEPPADSVVTGGAANKKLIYDRIIGDQEVRGEQIVPTEEPPIAPATEQPAATGNGQIPQPAGASQDGQPADDSEPLALPPPPGESGSNDSAAPGAKQQTTALKTTDTQAAAAQPGAGQTDSEVATLPATETDGSAEALQPPAPATTELAAAASEAASGETVEAIAEPQSPAAEPAKKKVATTKKAATAEKKPAGDEAALGPAPVVLVPPAEYDPPTSSPGTAASQSAAAGGDQAETKKKKRTLLDLLQGKGSSGTAGDARTAASQAGDSNAGGTATEPGDQVASIEKPAPAPQQNAASTAASGYVVQLASFRSEAEAQSEFGRLKSKYPSIIGGLPPRINQATVSGTTRYRLGLGPMASREEASKLCGSLVAAGERDCLVRKQ